MEQAIVRNTCNPSLHWHLGSVVLLSIQVYWSNSKISVEQQVLVGPGMPEYEEGVTVGDCTRACIASIFELKLHDVPHFALYPADYDPDTDPLADHGPLWYRALRKWTFPAFDWECINHEVPLGERIVPKRTRDPVIGLGIIQSPRGRFKHHVVVGGVFLEVLWDPHPNQDAYDKQVESFIVARPGQLWADPIDDPVADAMIEGHKPPSDNTVLSVDNRSLHRV